MQSIYKFPYESIFVNDFHAPLQIATPELTQQHTVPKVTEHIWAMKTIQDLINQYSITDNPDARRALADRMALLATR